MKLSFRSQIEIIKRDVKFRFSSTKPHISLLTDFGNDGSAYAIESSIKAIEPRIEVRSITNEIPLGKVLVGATRFMKAVTLESEKEGNAYIAVVDPGVGTKRRNLIIQTKSGKFLIGPDNGVLSLAADKEGIEKIIQIQNMELTNLKTAKSITFHGKDVFAPAAAQLLRGVSIDEFGNEVEIFEINKIGITDYSKANGHIIDVDGVGAIRTSIPNDYWLNEVGKKVNISIFLKERVKLEAEARLVKTFGEVNEDGSLLAVLSSSGCIDIAIKNGKASEKFKIFADDLSLNEFNIPSYSLLIC